MDTDCGNRPNSPLSTLVATATVSQTTIWVDVSVFDTSVDVWPVLFLKIVGTLNGW